MVIGAPGRPGFLDDVHAFRTAWPGIFASAFGADVPAVAPRLLVSSATGGTLEAVRAHLGQLVGEVKIAHPEPGSEGVLVEIA